MNVERKCYLLLILAGFLCLCACNGEKLHNYDSLPEEQKSEIDFLLSKSRVWESDKCDVVGFTKRKGELQFSVFYLEDLGDKSYYGWQKWYSYSESKKRFVESGKQYEAHVLNSGSSGKLVYSKEWSSGWSETEKKDYLAEKLYIATAK